VGDGPSPVHGDVQLSSLRVVAGDEDSELLRLAVDLGIWMPFFLDPLCSLAVTVASVSF
jgi:hypothetical protein